MSPVAIALLAVASVFTVLSSITTGIVLLRIEGRAKREQERDRKLDTIAGDMRSLREGMSVGAREAIRGLASRLDTVEDDAEERREAVAVVRERVAALDRTVEGHIRTPGPLAHPPVFGPPAPA